MNRKTVRMKSVIALLFLSAFFSVKAQITDRLPRFSEIPSFNLPVTYSKTTNLVFPYNIKSVDRGSKNLLAQKAKGVENVLQVKAGQTGFTETNLSVITGDGRLYSFRVFYTDDPGVLNLSFLPDTVNSQFTPLPDKQPVKLSNVPVDDHTLQTDSDKAKRAKAFLHKQTAENKVSLSLKSIYVKDKVMWFALEVRNYSLLDYEPSFIRFFQKDKKKGKRTTQQETELQPLFVEKGNIAGGQSAIIIMGFPQFTIPKDQRLVIQVGEQNGGRLLALDIKSRIILKAKALQP